MQIASSALEVPPSSDPRSAEDLLQAIARREESALAELFHRYGGRILAYVRVMGGPRFPAEDAVQEIFLALWQKARLFSPEGGRAEGWIFTLTRHRVLDICRAQRCVREDGLPDLDRLPTPDLDRDHTLGLSLRKALKMLHPDQQLPLRLAYYGGLTYEETALRLGIPVGTIKSRIRSGLTTLKTLLSTPGGAR